MANRLDVSDQTAISMPMRNLLSIITAVAIGVWAYFGVLERITMLETKAALAEKDLNQAVEMLTTDLEKNTEFRIKYPRGQLGKSSGEAELYMLVEDLYKSVDRLNKAIEDGMHNKVNIEFLQKQVEKATIDIEKLKDRQREFANGGKHQ